MSHFPQEDPKEFCGDEGSWIDKHTLQSGFSICGTSRFFTHLESMDFKSTQFK